MALKQHLKVSQIGSQTSTDKFEGKQTTNKFDSQYGEGMAQDSNLIGGAYIDVNIQETM